VFADFWALTPEANSFRLASGAGPAAHAGQLAGYEVVAASHTAQAGQMMATTASALTTWEGVGSIGMAATASPLAAWNGVVGAFAQKAVSAIAGAQSAYSAALSATVHYTVAIANRVQEAVLESTNFLGVNAIPIAVNNAQYAEFWAQNASASTGYGAAAVPLISALSIPLTTSPLGANPAGMAAGAAAVGVQAAASGIQALGAGLSEASGAGTEALGSAAGVSAGAAASALGASNSGQEGAGGQVGATGSGIPGSDQAGDNAQFLSQAQAMAGPMLSAPASALQSVTSPLTQSGSELMSGVGQFGSMGGSWMSPGALASSGLGSGAGPGLSALSAGVPGAAGLSGGNGGFAGGGSAVTAALTKPTAGGAMSGPVGLPGSWWTDAAEEKAPTAATARAGAGVGGVGGAGAPGMYGMGAPGGGRARSNSRDAADADKRVLLGGGGGGMPVFTDDGGVVYVGGQGV
jgi:PPE-repeat protein